MNTKTTHPDTVLNSVKDTLPLKSAPSTETPHNYSKTAALLNGSIKQNGYVTVNVDGVYFFTMGMGKKGKRDLFAVGHAPYSMFQIIADRYHREPWVLDTVYTIPEFKIPGLLQEPSRVKIQGLNNESVEKIKEHLTKLAKGFYTDGYNAVLLPDHNNLLHGDEGSAMVKTQEKCIDDLVKIINS